ncbi:PEP-CTERM system histidine kinase PrsK [Altererythrobacter sp. SALINAS58]|nr:PEP-CTERM system histidine kinase PrsK [Alteripontixanthobacter muriae]
MAGFVMHLAGAVACLLGAAWLLRTGPHRRSDRVPTAIALFLSSLWCTMALAFGPLSQAAAIAESLRNLGWFAVLYALFALDGRHRSMAQIRPVLMALALLEILQPLMLALDDAAGSSDTTRLIVFQTSTLFRVLVAVGALMLIHNLYGGASQQSRQIVRWGAAGLALLWAFDLNFYTVGYLDGRASYPLGAVRGMVMALCVIPLMLGLRADAGLLRLKPSRVVAFQTLSLIAIGLYLLFMVAIAQALGAIDGGVGRLTQVAFVLVAIVAALLWLPSQRLRSWSRVQIAKHLFQHRYDYREEWLRFNRTVGRASAGDDSSTQGLGTRIAKALADITDSPGALLLTPEEESETCFDAAWNWSGADMLPCDLPATLVARLERENHILDIDAARIGGEQSGPQWPLPLWLLEEDRAWALVPLLHFERLVGIVVLARPVIARKMDWEDFDLLKIAGQQLASYLAERDGQEALMQAGQFDEFNRRIAFVMHDIKNLASQLSLLARNAEVHVEKPEFRADMLVTLRNSADKLNGLLARLGRYGSQGRDECAPVDLAVLSRRIAGRFSEAGHRVAVTRADTCQVLASPEGLEQALIHLVQNAVDAGGKDDPVTLDVTTEGLHGCVQIVDSGTGMSPQFIRNGLFKPFISKKQGGFGIGAFEARELVRAMDGRLDVESREDMGTRFFLRLPLAAAAEMLKNDSDAKEFVAKRETA